MRKDGKYFY